MPEPQVQIQTLYLTPNSQTHTTVLWVSRHPPIEAQIKALEEKLGAVKVIQLSGFIPNAEFVVEKAKEVGAKYIVPVLPLSFIARLVELSRRNGFTVLWAEMQQVSIIDHEPVEGKDYDPATEVWIKGYENTYKIMRFKQYHIIKAIRLELEPW